jgi:hypothetical protein
VGARAWWVWNRFVSVHAALYRVSGGRVGGTQARSSRDIPVIRLRPG